MSVHLTNILRLKVHNLTIHFHRAGRFATPKKIYGILYQVVILIFLLILLWYQSSYQSSSMSSNRRLSSSADNSWLNVISISSGMSKKVSKRQNFSTFDEWWSDKYIKTNDKNHPFRNRKFISSFLPCGNIPSSISCSLSWFSNSWNCSPSSLILI